MIRMVKTRRNDVLAARPPFSASLVPGIQRSAICICILEELEAPLSWHQSQDLMRLFEGGK